jgi:hypothetical protein
MKFVLASLTALILAACGGPPDAVDGDGDGGQLGLDASPSPFDARPSDGDGGGSTADAAPDQPDAVPGLPDAATAAPKVDILFVIDDSGGMTAEQDAFLGSIGSFLGELRIEAGGVLPSLHLGVVSTNLGAGPFGIGGCPTGGDGAVLLNTPQLGGCSAPSDRYIIAETAGTGGRTRNYAGGTLGQAVECIGSLGTGGCGFEQPLEAMRRALDGSVGENAGFLRGDALLVVVILTNEDDCSASDTNLYNPGDGTFGPLSSFRCFAAGVECSPDEPAVPGVKTGCMSREDSAFIFPVQGYIDFLKTLKPPGRVVAAAFIADDSPVEVGTSGGGGGGADLLSACVPATGGADPAIRLHMLLGGFGASGGVPAMSPAAA